MNPPRTVCIRIAGPRQAVTDFASQLSQLFGISEVTAIYDDKGRGNNPHPHPNHVHQRLTVFVPDSPTFDLRPGRIPDK